MKQCTLYISLKDLKYILIYFWNQKAYFTFLTKHFSKCSQKTLESPELDRQGMEKYVQKSNDFCILMIVKAA